MADGIVARLERLGWRRNAAGELCQPPDCRPVQLAEFCDEIGCRYRIKAAGDRVNRDLWIRGAGSQLLGKIQTDD